MNSSSDEYTCQSIYKLGMIYKRLHGHKFFNCLQRYSLCHFS